MASRDSRERAAKWWYGAVPRHLDAWIDGDDTAVAREEVRSAADLIDAVRAEGRREALEEAITLANQWQDRATSQAASDHPAQRAEWAAIANALEGFADEIRALAEKGGTK